MTGYGKASVKLPSRDISIEIKSLNSKQLDLYARIPSAYSGLEGRIRNMVSKSLERGKIDLTISIENQKSDKTPTINTAVIKGYKAQIENSAAELGISTPNDWFALLLKLPDAIISETPVVDEDEETAIMNGLEEALEHINAFRKQEGEMLQNLFARKIENIAALLKEVGPYEQERIDKTKARIMEGLEKLHGAEYDKNRLEQEIIYYIEKLDINEEKHRLDNHLKYFMETMEGRQGQGKKLGFIAQEMGREINTLGSKANHAEMQRIVVKMKDELEQIKEQILNAL